MPRLFSSNEDKYVNQYGYGPPVEVPESALRPIEEDDRTNIQGTAAPYESTVGDTNRSINAKNVKPLYPMDDFKYTAQNAERLVSEYQKQVEMRYPTEDRSRMYDENKPQGERVDFVQPAITDAHNTRKSTGISLRGSSPVRKLSAFSIGRRKKEEADLIARLTAVPPDSSSIHSMEGLDDDDFDPDRVDLPKPEDYGARPRSGSITSRRGRRRTGSLRDANSTEPGNGNKVLNGFMKLFGGRESRDRSPDEHVLSSRVRDAHDLRADHTASAEPTNIAEIIGRLWIALITMVEPLNFLLLPINSTHEGTTSRTAIIFVEIFISMWVMYYVLILLEAIFSVIKVICSPVVYIAGIFTGRRG